MTLFINVTSFTTCYDRKKFRRYSGNKLKGKDMNEFETNIQTRKGLYRGIRVTNLELT